MSYDRDRAAAEQARREQAFWEQRRVEETRLQEERRLADARHQEERRLAADRSRRDAEQARRVADERTRRSDAWKKSQEAPPPPPPKREVPLDAVGRRKALVAAREASAERPSLQLGRGVRASRLIQSLGPMGKGRR